MYSLGLLAFILPACAMLQAWLQDHTTTPLLIYSSSSTLSFLVYGYDKYRATSAGWRVRENLLHLLDFVGGWPGGFLAQYYFKHKTRKTLFQLIFWGTVALHQYFCIRRLFFDQGTGSQRLDS
jgi:uncharacterized membrane protein YsdA (DUF1294 family)